MAGNFAAFGPGEPRLDRATLLEHLKTLELTDYSLGDIQTELNSRTMVVLYTVTMRGTAGGKPLPEGPVRMMTVWQQQKAGWMMITHAVLGP